MYPQIVIESELIVMAVRLCYFFIPGFSMSMNDVPENRVA